MSDTTLKGKLPNTFLLGAAKAGTTTLFQALKQYPQVFLPYAKEPEFFSQDQLFAKGIEWYCSTFFHNARCEQIRLDATPHYLYWSEKVAAHIKGVYQKPPKFIVVLRDPVDRAYSWYWNMMREGLEDQSFQIALKLEDSRLAENLEKFSQNGAMTFGYVRGSMYAERLEPFFEYFPRSAFHFVKFLDLVNDFPVVMERLAVFLEIPEQEIPAYQTAWNQSTGTYSTALQKWIRKDHNLPAWIKRLMPDQLRYQLKGKFRSLNQRRSSYPPLTEELEKTLRLKFVDDIHRLTAMTGLDFSEWLPQ